jgi:hypothetical protein
MGHDCEDVPANLGPGLYLKSQALSPMSSESIISRSNQISFVQIRGTESICVCSVQSLLERCLNIIFKIAENKQTSLCEERENFAGPTPSSEEREDRNSLILALSPKFLQVGHLLQQLEPHATWTVSDERRNAYKFRPSISRCYIPVSLTSLLTTLAMAPDIGTEN